MPSKRVLFAARPSQSAAGKKVGNTVLFGIAGSIIGLGFWAWLSSNLTNDPPLTRGIMEQTHQGRRSLR